MGRRGVGGLFTGAFVGGVGSEFSFFLRFFFLLVGLVFLGFACSVDVFP